MNVFKYVDFWYPKTAIDQNSSAMNTFEASIYKKLIFNGHGRPFWGNGPVCLVYQYLKEDYNEMRGIYINFYCHFDD